MDSEAAALVRLQFLGVPDTGGKHCLQAELKRLEQEARYLEVTGLNYIFIIISRALRLVIMELIDDYHVAFDAIWSSFIEEALY